jgi:hypothetical protein
MATISFHADNMHILNLSGSGLGFFGSSFGQSVEVGAYQDSTYITDGTGSTQGGAVVNNKYIHPASGENSTIGSDPINLLAIPNRLATLNIRFEHGSAVKLQNTQLRIFDRSNINNPASGVTTKVAQIIHPNMVQSPVTPEGSGDSSWSTPAGSAVILDLSYSPGYSGIYGTSTYHESTRHDYYCVISASPNSIGSKTLYGLYVSTEYL